MSERVNGIDISLLKREFIEKQLGSKYRDDLSILNKEDIKIAIKQAYLDSQLRTIPGHKEVADMLYDGENSPFECLCTKIEKYFQNNAPENIDNFDKMHKEMCDSFLEKYNEILVQKKLIKQKFGRAQKVVNMTFKYLYCFSDCKEKEEWFNYCHMPLDHYTLDLWFVRTIKCNSHPVLKKDIEKWSKLEYGSTDKAGTYFWIQKNIREYFDSEHSKMYHFFSSDKAIVLKAEFLIWYEEMLKEALEKINKLSLPNAFPHYQNSVMSTLIKDCETKCQEFAERF